MGPIDRSQAACFRTDVPSSQHGLSNEELEKLAEVGIADALEKLHQALSAHEKKLAEIRQQKTGRSALVGAQKKRVNLLQRLIPAGERRMQKLQEGLRYLS